VRAHERRFLRIVIPNEVRDLQFATKCKSLPFGATQGRDDKPRKLGVKLGW